MALDSLYMISPSLQEYFVDKTTGEALSSGSISFYKDNDRAVLKEVFTLTGGVDAYVYTPIINPVLLSGVGTPTDGFNNDIVIYLYPYDSNGNVELYYVVVKDADGITQFTRQAWPNLVEGTSTETFAYNYARNWSFYSWSNATSYENIKNGSATDTDFVVDDWAYSQNDTAQIINITQGIYTTGDNSVPTNSPYYLIYENTLAASGGTYNYFYQTYESVETLQGQEVAVEIWLRRPTPSISGDIVVSLTQHFGTGGTPSDDVTTTVLTVGLSPSSSSWQRFTGSVLLPSTSGKSRGTNGDDNLILNINMPLNQLGIVHIGLIRLEEGSDITGTQIISNDAMQAETNSFAIYPTFTTGDVKFTLKNVSDPGWLLMDDKLLGNQVSTADHKGVGLFALYSLIWNNVRNNVWAPIYTNARVLSTYGASASADWYATKLLSLPKTLGRVLAGAGQGIISTSVTFNVTPANSVTFNDGPGGASSYFTGTPIVFTTTGSLPSTTPQIVAGTTYYAIFSGNDQLITVATSLANAYAGTSIVVNTAGSGNIGTTTFSSWALAEYYGEENHGLTGGEGPSHVHGALNGGFIGNSGSSIAQGTGSAAWGQGATTAISGQGLPHNNIQLTTYMNIMIKI